MSRLVFDILVDETLSAITSEPELKYFVNKRVLSLINDFEDQKWRSLKFHNYLWDNIAQTALSERERAALADQSHTSLVAAAQNLRLTDSDDIGQGSEIAEVFLYGLMKHHFGALPVVPKIFYKQNVQDNAKGADSVHIVVNGDDFTLWFGEAKFYNSIDDGRLDSVVASVVASLQTNKLKKENSIITNTSDIDTLPISEAVRTKIRSALNLRESIDTIKSKIHIPILLLHECNITKTTTLMSESYKSGIIDFHTKRADSYFRKQIAKSTSILMYEHITFHIILFPVPDKQLIVDAFNRKVRVFKEGM